MNGGGRGSLAHSQSGQPTSIHSLHAALTPQPAPPPTASSTGPPCIIPSHRSPGKFFPHLPLLRTLDLTSPRLSFLPGLLQLLPDHPDTQNNHSVRCLSAWPLHPLPQTPSRKVPLLLCHCQSCSFLRELLHSLHVPANCFLLAFPTSLRLSITCPRKPPHLPPLLP